MEVCYVQMATLPRRTKESSSSCYPVASVNMFVYVYIYRSFSLLLIGSNLITAANFCLNGKFAVVGTYDGRCIFYETEVR